VQHSELQVVVCLQIGDRKPGRLVPDPLGAVEHMAKIKQVGMLQLRRSRLGHMDAGQQIIKSFILKQDDAMFQDFISDPPV